MKCVDCLKEIDDKEYYNKSDEGVCKKCRQRKSQIKYENKKFGTNKVYVPLRLKKTTTKRKKNAVSVKNEQIDDTKLYGKEIENKVNGDIKKVFDKYGISIKENDAVPLQMFMNMFETLLDVRNGYMNNYIKAEDLFNMLERDYQHAFEDADTVSKMEERSKMFKCLLDRRRNVKNINIQYNQISRIIYEILDKIPDMLEKVHISNEKLEEIIKKQEEHYYRAEMSELVQEEDFCKGNKSVGKFGMKKYDVSVPIFNYGNNSAGIPYDFHRFAYAKDKIDAINQVKAFLTEKFPKCTYKSNDFLAVELYDAITTTGQEVCL